MEPSYHDEGEEYAATPLEPDATPGQSPDLAAAGLIPADDDEFERQLHEAISAKAQTVEPAAAQILRPLSHDRIKAALEAENWTFSVDSDGDIGGLWDSNIFYFFTYGEQKEILQIRGRWHQDLPIDLRPQVREALDEWHFAKIWPKGYTTVDDSGRVWVLAEHSVD
ncbi:MAG: YbjN domain-containing protein, partial [Bifidobacteriaceae bacterium]|nr:YbjN domain-containing protein [Bifidobacteriaceae bacterium]